jgi:hypothetical protein
VLHARLAFLFVRLNTIMARVSGICLRNRPQGGAQEVQVEFPGGGPGGGVRFLKDEDADARSEMRLETLRRRTWGAFAVAIDNFTDEQCQAVLRIIKDGK